MELFKRQETITDTADLPEVFITITDPSGVTLPSAGWCRFLELGSFVDLVTPSSDEIVIVACPDNLETAAMLRLVIENGATCGVSVVRVNGATPYVASSVLDSAMWQVRVVDFTEWQHEADEAARLSELARRSELTKDDLRREVNARADGSFKEVKASVGTEVEDEAPEALVL